MTMTDSEWDKLLQIKTTGRDDTHADVYRYPYEPTPYSVLERLANAGYIRKGNTLLDYGCGTIGVEYDERIYETAMENLTSGAASGRVSFVLANAEHFAVPEKVDRIYFFNPFSLQILQKAMSRILASYYAAPRDILLFFYYPSDEYMAYLLAADELTVFDEIDCRDLEGNNERERIVIFALKGMDYGED